ncbi:lipoprotein-releasing system permease protein [Solimonas aquatica]|uniref:Lipoprotein-releasing system permease protein n=1 Tax=Solimonas aquatica TaxID=489703 RepID=A0A1H9CHB8_9GAMM|nr:lipoprotein-releasing ABC transporter permease subunit [Solimonas aquatica]SEQ00630.1 lipoprotein-releasing system permease protein [Solimonas aquatica]
MHAWYELLVGLRYTRAKRRNHFISFISAASMAGIAVGVTALITVLSVMNGFESELRTRILGMASHATISAYQGGLSDWAKLAELARQHPDVAAVAPYIEGEGMVKVGSDLSGTLLRGIDPKQEATVSEIAQHMKVGQLDSLTPGSYNIVLGAELAESLNVTAGDKIDLMVPQASVTPAGLLPRFRRFTVSGVFRVGMYEFDRGLVLIDLADAQALLRMDNSVTGVRLKLHDLFQAPRVARELTTELPGLYYVSDWTRSHSNFFRAVKTEKMVMFIILSLIVGVAAFNIVSTLVMVVQDKQPDIAILRTLGATPRSIMAIFMVQGCIIGFVGTALGLAGGIALALNVETLVPLLERLTHQQFLAPDVYYISDLPSELKLSDVIRIGALSLSLGLISTIYPAWRASRINPAEALRYE